MTDPKVLEKYGCSPERLRVIFTSPYAGATPDQRDAPGMPDQQNRKLTDGEIRGAFEARIRSRLLDGITNNFKTSKPYQAVDISWDIPPIQPETLPLMMYAMGKIEVGGLLNCLERDCGTSTAAKFFSKDKVDGRLKVNIPRLTDISIDLMRSYITRRLAAIDGLWSNLWPLWKYDARGADDSALLRADVLTQRVDMISDSYNYRHFGSQCRRDMLLYGRSVAFARTAWNRVISWQFKPTNTGEPGQEVESTLEREGVDFINPHPSRIFHDLSSPLANINTDTGPRWVGYWDIVRYGSLKDAEQLYYNLDHIFLSSAWFALANQYADFLRYYFDPTVLIWPDPTQWSQGLGNDRSAHVGLYTAVWKDRGVLVTQYYEKINPKREGIGDYDADVWIRLVVAGDYTVVYAEFMPSIPCAVGAINWNDNRLANQSMGMALLGFQDQASNIMSHMLQQIKQSLVMLMLIDKDSLEEPVRNALIKAASGKDWLIDPQLLIYSATKLRDLGIQNPKDAFHIVQTQMTNVITTGLSALGQLLNLADRLLVLSPNELGQPNQREVSAREVQEISTSVQSVYSFINQGPREQTAAMKKLVFEALMCCGTDRIRVPIEGSYTMEVVKAAGFDVGPEFKDKEDLQVVPSKAPILGSLQNLDYEYYFDSRDGSERVVNPQGAQVVQQLLGTILKVPGIPEMLGKKKIVDAINLIIRMSGAPWNAQIDLPVGGEDTFQAPSGQPTAPGVPGQPGAPGQPPGLPPGLPPNMGTGNTNGNESQAIQILQAQQNRTAAMLQQLVAMVGAARGGQAQPPGPPGVSPAASLAQPDQPPQPPAMAA